MDTVLEAGWLMAKAEGSFSVLHLVLDSGERLPCLIDATTWIPARVALRWALRYRRYRVQSSMLASHLRVLAKVYRRTQEIAGLDLDDRLTQGRTLQNRKIESLARSFRGLGAQELDTGAFDQHLAILEESGPELEKRFFEGQAEQLRTELEMERERNRQLVGRIAVIETNAGRLGIDPEELYRAVLKPVRSMSRAGSNNNGARNRFRRS